MSTPLLNSNFEVVIDNLPSLGFCSVEGIEAVLAATPGEKPTGGARRQQPAAVTLRRGVTGPSVLWEWYAAERAGEDARRTCAILIREPSGQPVLRVTLRNCRPRRWRLGLLDAVQPSVLIEEIELLVQSFDIGAA